MGQLLMIQVAKNMWGWSITSQPTFKVIEVIADAFTSSIEDLCLPKLGR